MPQDIEDFLALLPDHVEEAVAAPRFRNPAFCDFLLKRIPGMLSRDPQTAMAAAKAALRLTASLGDFYFAAAWRVWSAVQVTLGNYAQAHWGDRLADFYRTEVAPAGPAHYQVLQLARDCRFNEAKRVAISALAAAKLGEDPHLKGLAVADLAFVHELAEEMDAAASRWIEALHHLDATRDVAAYSRAVQAVAHVIDRCRRVPNSLSTDFVELRLRTCVRGSRQWFQLRWLEGLIYRTRQLHPKAFLTLRPAHAGLLRTGEPQDVVFVTLDLVEALLRHDQVQSVASLLCDTAKVFQKATKEQKAFSTIRRIASRPRCLVSYEELSEIRKKLYRQLILDWRKLLPVDPSSQRTGRLPILTPAKDPRNGR